MVMSPSAVTTIQERHPLSIKSTPDDVHNGRPNSGATKSHGEAKGRDLIGEALRKRVAVIDQDTCEPGEEDAFFVADLGEVYRQHLRWKKNLKRVKPHYGWFLMSLYSDDTKLTSHQPLSATRIQKSFVYLPRSERGSTAPLKPRSSKFWRWAFTLPASSTHSRAKPSRTCGMPLRQESSR